MRDYAVNLQDVTNVYVHFGNFSLEMLLSESPIHSLGTSKPLGFEAKFFRCLILFLTLLSIQMQDKHLAAFTI